MPFVRIALAGPQLENCQVAELQRQITGLMSDILGKRRDLTVVAVDQAQAGAWSVGGRSLDAAFRCAQIDAFVTAGTNSEDEKRLFLQAAHALLQDILGRTDAPVYVIVHEVPAPDWGFDGLSQAARRLATTPI
jgi:4-oxalocrotonate tautomerase